jgi:RimJ/RimL family protein N-acetyltransferase
MKLKRFIAHFDAENQASVRVMEKLGMTYVETHGGRYNRSTKGERLENLYEIVIG